MPSRQTPFSLRKLSGRNPTDPPHDLQPDMAQEVQNVDFFQATLGRRRPGSASDTAVFGGITFNERIRFLQDHMPDENTANRELWAADNSNTSAVQLARRAGASATVVAQKDTIKLGTAGDIRGVSFNGKFFLALETTDTDLDRLHVWDPGDTEVRRVGLATAGDTLVAASVGAGSGLDFERHYRYAFVEMLNGDTDGTVERRSELSITTTITPNTSSTGVRLTQPTLPGEKETHWEVYADTADTSGVFYRIARVVVDAATATTYDDGAAGISGYNTQDISDDTGINTPPKAARYLVADESRILMGGSFLDTGRKSRIEYTPVLGDRDIGDDERIVLSGGQRNRIDLGEGDGSGLSGLAGPVFGAFYAFKTNQVWKLVPTGVLDSPYRPVNLSKVVGCVDDHSIVVGRDETGKEAIYFMSADGPQRIGVRGLEYLGHSVEDKRPNVDATGVICHAIFIQLLQQVWFWVSTGSANDPTHILVFHVKKGIPDEDNVVRKGWAVYTGTLASALASTMMSNTLGASMSGDLKPYMGANDTNVVLKGDNTALNQDAGTSFQAFVKTRAESFGGLTREFGLGQGYLLATKQDTTVNIGVTVDRDFGRETRTFTSDLSGDTEATRVSKVFEVDLADATFVEFTIGDTAAANVDWQFDAFDVLISDEGTK